MKLSCWIVSAFASALLCQAAMAQEIHSLPKPLYLMVDYMKVTSDKADAYVNIEKKVWKPIHEKRLKDGLIRGWYLYRVDNPPEARRDYSFVTVNVFDSFAKLEDPHPEKYFTNVPAEELQRTSDSRELIRSEVWRLEESLMAAPAEDPFIVVDYHQPTPGNEMAYRALESDVWKKIHEARIKGGVMNAWLGCSRVFPGGSQIPFQFVTVNVFPTREPVSNPSADEAVNRAIQGMSDEQRALFINTDSLRTIVREDIWKRIDQVLPVPDRD